MIGKTLGNFEITSQIGKGGMGEVFRAKDQKLGRDVAIKVLPEEFARDSDRVARFQREAKLLASLNHPNIGSIYGLEEAEGNSFLVLELIEGDTLSDRLKHGAIPVEEARKLALQIAEALEAAHEKGVIHRDLKPANIKVTPDGKVKVLDFGLAKAYAGEQEEVNLSNSPTLSDAATQQGVILGTAAYMSPEQACGKQVDKRADVWAFGCVLYEMLAGKAAFSGRDVTDILAAVIRAEPEWKSLPANLHWRLREVLERCLEKEAKDRYGSINDARVDIQRVLKDPSGVFVQAGAVAEPGKKMQLGLQWIAGAVVLTAVIVGLVIWYLKPAPLPEPRQVIRFDYVLPEDQQLPTGASFTLPVLSVSPDGTRFIYCTPDGLYLRSVDESDARLIPGTNRDPEMPFFSPDGKSIGFFSAAEGRLMKIALGGGAPVPLCEVDNFTGASWGADGTIVFGDRGKGIMRIPASGGAPEIIVKQSETGGLPQILPDGKSVLYTSPLVGQSQIMLGSLESGESKELFAGAGARYLPTGHLVYKVENNLYAVPFDLQVLEEAGGAASVVEGIRLAPVTNLPHYAISDSGTLVYLPGPIGAGATDRTLAWVNMEGRVEPLNAQPDFYRTPRISPDGTRIALTVGPDESAEIWVWDNVRENRTRLTFYEENDSSPLWSQDGKRIAFLSAREGGGIYWKRADGTGEIEQLGSVKDMTLWPWSWSGDGKFLINSGWDGGTRFDIGMLSMEGDRSRKPLLQKDYFVIHPRISPNGRLMAYASNETGQVGVYVCTFPDVDEGKWQVSTDIGDTPLWSPDGRELFYLSNDAVMVVPVDTESTFSHRKPKKLFQKNFITGYGEAPAWDIHPDGKRFVMLFPGASADDASIAARPRKINIVLNWFEILKERMQAE